MVRQRGRPDARAGAGSGPEPDLPRRAAPGDSAALHAVDRVVGQFLLVLLLEVGLIWAFDSTSPWAELEVLAVGALGAPWTIACPWLLLHDHDAAALSILIVGPILNLAIRYWVAWNRLDAYQP